MIELWIQAKFSNILLERYIFNPSQRYLVLVNLLIEDTADMLIKVLDEIEVAIISNVLNNIVFQRLIDGLKTW